MRTQTLYKRYRTMAAGGNFQGTVGAGAGLVNSGIDLFAPANEYKRQSVGAMTAKGAASGAAAGAIAGPWGAAIGGVVGGAIGFVGGKGAQKKEQRFLSARYQQQTLQDAQRSQMVLASDPSLLQGDEEANYFKNGGMIKRPDGGPILARTRIGTDRDRIDLHDAITYRLAYGSNPNHTSSGYTAVANPANRAILNDAALWSQRDDQKGLTPQARIEAYFNRPGGTDPVSATRANLKSIGYGPVATWQNSPSMELQGQVARRANGGHIKSPLVTQYMNGGTATALSKDSVEMSGNTHANGGIKIPSLQTEVENNETVKGNFVFSDRLGFAKLHKPIARSIGKIEERPPTRFRTNSLQRLRAREDELAAAQEQLKLEQGIN